MITVTTIRFGVRLHLRAPRGETTQMCVLSRMLSYMHIVMMLSNLSVRSVSTPVVGPSDSRPIAVAVVQAPTCICTQNKVISAPLFVGTRRYVAARATAVPQSSQEFSVTSEARGNRVLINATVNADVCTAAYNRTMKKIRKEAKIEGFR